MKRLLPIALFALALTACGTAAAQTEPFDNDAYLAAIQAEATRTADINNRTDALLTANEALWPTVQAFYGGVSEFQSGATIFQYEANRMENIIAAFAPTPQPVPTPEVIIQYVPQPFDLNALSEGERRSVACVLLTVEYIDAWPGFGPATAGDIRANLGC